MQNPQEIFNQIQEAKKKQREIRKEYKDALANTAEYDKVMEKYNELKEKKETTGNSCSTTNGGTLRGIGRVPSRSQRTSRNDERPGYFHLDGRQKPGHQRLLQQRIRTYLQSNLQKSKLAHQITKLLRQKKSTKTKHHFGGFLNS